VLLASSVSPVPGVDSTGRPALISGGAVPPDLPAPATKHRPAAT